MLRVVVALCEASIRYCETTEVTSLGESESDFKSPRDVLKAVRPFELFIPKPKRKKIPVVQLRMECNWEVEHNMEWAIREDKVYYVGSIRGIDPFRIKKDRWNFA